MKSTIAKKTEGYGYKYTELADINKYCEANGITYFQEVETSEINQKDYIMTTLISYDKNGEPHFTKHRGCQIVEAVLKGIKNPVQEYGSSLTYCRRYSLLMALGLATEDDDGQCCSEPITMTQEEAEAYTLTFGKYAGKTLVEIYKEDKKYIEWILNNSKDERILRAIELSLGIKIPGEEEQTYRQEAIKKILDLTLEKDIDLEEVKAKFNVNDLKELTTEQMKKCISAMEKKEN